MMLDEDFCEFLENELTKAFAKSTYKEVRNLWCDGVLLPALESEYSPKFVNDNRRIIMTSFIGKSGQDEYELTLHFGSRALSNYSKGLGIKECFPINKKTDWFDIDIEKQKIVIMLD
jgi:hypothetical protein